MFLIFLLVFFRVFRVFRGENLKFFPVPHQSICCWAFPYRRYRRSSAGWTGCHRAEREYPPAFHPPWPPDTATRSVLAPNATVLDRRHSGPGVSCRRGI